MYSYSHYEVNAIKCDCRTKEEEDKTRDHLRLVIRISALKLLPTVREVIYQSGAEKMYLLDRAKYEVIKGLRGNYGNLLSQTDIIPSLEILINSLRDLVNDEKNHTINEIRAIVNDSVTKFHKTVLPSAFLCFALGTCRTANTFYMECMRNNVQHWMTFFGDEPQKMTNKLSDALFIYRRVDNILQALHNALITAEDQVTSECARRFTDVTTCSKCLTDDSVGYCRSSCQRAAFGCLENLARNWETNIDQLYELTRNFEEGFQQLVQGIMDGMRKLVESKAPKLAKVVVSKCGPLLKNNAYMTPSTLNKPQKPKEVNAKTKELVEQLRTLRKCWAQIADRTCSEASEQSFCWNGTNIVRLQVADDFSIGTKDVRPRPKVSAGGRYVSSARSCLASWLILIQIPGYAFFFVGIVNHETWLESSGHPYDTDDEDFIGGSGSGMPVEEVQDDATVYTIAPGDGALS
ncbi:hypothetical protein NECAME_00639 [Necator americanus]|uniref:Glypican n=1 Tax=Necator americanus TaxID=51031 RepID=W2T000_NECAM|nr:hypothetical protein NECAME_00639 [Necator americanus]ETN75228.1 hypothetical protein NECAME_00639 [Necator americanus]